MSLGIYVHIPFCAERCFYCDFLTFPHAEKFHAPYGLALQKEITHAAWASYPDRTVDSIFFGGGTPTLLPASRLAAFLASLRRAFLLAEDAEITLEANPGTLTREGVHQLVASGVNRISLGVQTTNDALLKAIGRTHQMKDVLDDVEMLREAGIKNLNLDMILALPGQTPTDIENDLHWIETLRPTHVSWYSLILEEKTLFGYRTARGELVLPSEEEELALSAQAFKGLRCLGYVRYEFSNFAKPGSQSRHNLKYWSGDDYLGFGLGAASYIDGERYENMRGLKTYIETLERGELPRRKIVRSREDDLFEQVMTGLRKLEGIDRARFAKKNGIDPVQIAALVFRNAEREGLARITAERLALTEKGLLVQNSILSDALLYWEEEMKKTTISRACDIDK